MGNWRAIEVDGEHFEWSLVDTGIGEADGRPPHIPRGPEVPVRLLLLRRQGAGHSFGVVQEVGYDATDAAVAGEIRAWGSSTPLAPDWRPDERAHARELATRWGRLPRTILDELARTWLARCARRGGSVPTIADPNDLHEIAAKTLRVARAQGLEAGDEEAAAQERDVLAACDRHFGAGV